MYNVNRGFLPPVFSTLAPVRTAPADVRDAILTSHSTRSMFYTEKLVPLDGSSPVLSHVVIDHDFMTCAILEDNATFESARAEHYADWRASSTVSRLSPPACSVMPCVPPSVDLPPLPPCVAPALFTDDDLPDNFLDFIDNDELNSSFLSSTLNPMTFTSDDIWKNFPRKFSDLSTSQQEAVLRVFCGAVYSQYIADNVAEFRQSS